MFFPSEIPLLSKYMRGGGDYDFTMPAVKQGLLQALVSRLSLPGQQNFHTLQLSAAIPKHFVSSQHMEKIQSSSPILSTAQRATTVSTTVGLSLSLCRPTAVEVG